MVGQPIRKCISRQRYIAWLQSAPTGSVVCSDLEIWKLSQFAPIGAFVLAALCEGRGQVEKARCVPIVHGGKYRSCMCHFGMVADFGCTARSQCLYRWHLYFAFFYCRLNGAPSTCLQLGCTAPVRLLVVWVCIDVRQGSIG